MVRQVQFPDDEGIFSVVCTLPNREDLTEEDLELLWFSKEDYHMSRSEAKVISRESVHLGFSVDLEDTYTEKNSEAQSRLQQWASHDGSRRGLERWANKTHGEKRQQDQFDAIMSVLEAQDEMLANKNNGQVEPEKLRKVSNKATKTARHFARMLGKADSFAMANELGKAPSSSKYKNARDSDTVATEGSTRSGKDSHYTEIDEPESLHDVDVSISIIDDLTGSHHRLDNATRRFRRFGFRGGKNHKQESKKPPSSEEARVSRVA
jgi:hypothetical protein